MLTQGPTQDPKVQVDYFTIPYTSTFIRLSHFYQRCHLLCIVITINGWMG